MPGIEKLEWMLLGLTVVATFCSLFCVNFGIRTALSAGRDTEQVKLAGDLGAGALFLALTAVFCFIAYMTVEPTSMLR